MVLGKVGAVFYLDYLRSAIFAICFLVRRQPGDRISCCDCAAQPKVGPMQHGRSTSQEFRVNFDMELIPFEKLMRGRDVEKQVFVVGFKRSIA